MINSQSGFTLIEFLVATVILMVGLLGMLQAINVAMDKNVETIYRNEALMLADEQIMQIRNRAFLSISTTVTSPPKTSESRNVRGLYKNYSIQKIVTQPTSQSKEVTIRVTWKRKTHSYSHSLSSVITTN